MYVFTKISFVLQKRKAENIVDFVENLDENAVEAGTKELVAWNCCLGLRLEKSVLEPKRFVAGVPGKELSSGFRVNPNSFEREAVLPKAHR